MFEIFTALLNGRRHTADTVTLTPRYAKVAALTKERTPTDTPEMPRYIRAEFRQ